jgi:DNA-directed RNA polymerase subunit RPC12/RpoP
MTETYKCARCGSPVHDYSDADQRAACETCEDWVPVKEVSDGKAK